MIGHADLTQKPGEHLQQMFLGFDALSKHTMWSNAKAVTDMMLTRLEET